MQFQLSYRQETTGSRESYHWQNSAIFQGQCDRLPSSQQSKDAFHVPASAYAIGSDADRDRGRRALSATGLSIYPDRMELVGPKSSLSRGNSHLAESRKCEVSVCSHSSVAERLGFAERSLRLYHGQETPARGHEFTTRSHLLVVTFLHHYKPIGAALGGQTMSNGDHCPAPGGSSQTGVNSFFGFQIEDRDARVMEDGEGDGKALVPLSHQSVFPIREAHHEFVGLGDSCRLRYLCICGAGLGIADVLGHCAGEQEGILQHHAHLLSRRGWTPSGRSASSKAILPASTS